MGFVGAGFIARYHAMQLRLAAEPSEIVAVFDIDPSRARAFCDDEGGDVVGSIDDLLGRVDAVFVCTWTAAHDHAVRAVCDAGRALFCEKPLATDLDATAAMVRRVDEAAVPDMVGLVLRSSPALLAMRELLADPSVGRVQNVVFRDDQYLPTQGMYASTWRGDVALAGAGTLLEHSIHDLDLIEWLVGDLEVVWAQQSSFHAIEGIEDSVSVLARLRSGGTVSLASVWHDVLSRPSQRRVEVFCEKALITLEGEYFGPLRRQDSDGEVVLEGDELMRWLAERDIVAVSAEQQFLSTVRCWLAGEQVARLRPDVHDALRAHELVHAVYRSAEQGGAPVRTPLREA